MHSSVLFQVGFVSQWIVSILLLVYGLSIFVFGSGYYTVFPTNQSIHYKIGLILFFLTLTLLLNRSEQYKVYSPTLYAFFIAAANFLSWFFTPRILRSLKISTTSLKSMVMEKFYESFLVIITVIVLSKVAGEYLTTVFLQVGDLRLGLWIGLLSFTIFGFSVGTRRRLWVLTNKRFSSCCHGY